MMNFRDKKNSRIVAIVIVVLVCLGMVVGLMAGISGFGGM